MNLGVVATLQELHKLLQRSMPNRMPRPASMGGRINGESIGKMDAPMQIRDAAHWNAGLALLEEAVRLLLCAVQSCAVQSCAAPTCATSSELSPHAAAFVPSSPSPIVMERRDEYSKLLPSK